MDLEKIKTLRKKLVEAKEIQSVFEYFLDHFGEDPAFWKLGKPLRDPDPILKSVLAQVGQGWLNTEVVMMGMQLVEVKKAHLIHGHVAINGRATSVLYFDDIQTGIAGMMRPGGGVNWSRFSAQKLPKDSVPSEN